MERLGKSTKFKFVIGCPVYGSVFSLAFFTIEESLQGTNRWPNGLKTLGTRLSRRVIRTHYALFDHFLVFLLIYKSVNSICAAISQGIEPEFTSNLTRQCPVLGLSNHESSRNSSGSISWRSLITQSTMAVAGVWMVWLALVVVQLGFGAYGVIVSKFAKENKADPLIFSLIRDGGCFPVLLIAAFVSEKTIQIPSLRWELVIIFFLSSDFKYWNQMKG